MSTFSILIVIVTMILLPISIVAWIVQAVRKKPTKKIKLACLSLFCLFIIGTIMGITLSCNHEWADATCFSPRTCTLCKDTDGEPLGHSWAAATCDTPEICDRCNETRGNATGHDWLDATCTEPKTCQVCKATDGNPLGHTKGDWVVAQEATVYQPGIREQKCKTCGNVIKSEEFFCDPIIYSKDFGMTAAEFVSTFNKLTDGDYEIKPDGDNYVVHWLGTLDISTSLSFDANDAGLLTSISLDGRKMSDNGNQQVEVCWALYRVLNPHLSESDSMDEFKDAANSGGKKFIRGVRYLYTELSSLDVLWFTIQLV